MSRSPSPKTFAREADDADTEGSIEVGASRHRKMPRAMPQHRQPFVGRPRGGIEREDDDGRRSRAFHVLSEWLLRRVPVMVGTGESP